MQLAKTGDRVIACLSRVCYCTHVSAHAAKTFRSLEEDGQLAGQLVSALQRDICGPRGSVIFHFSRGAVYSHSGRLLVGVHQEAPVALHQHGCEGAAGAARRGAQHRLDGSASIEHVGEAHRCKVHPAMLLHRRHGDDGASLAFQPDGVGVVLSDGGQLFPRIVIQRPPPRRAAGRCQRLHVTHPHHGGKGRRLGVVHHELAGGAAPGGPLQVEHPHYPAVLIAVPHLEERLGIAERVLEQGVAGGAAWQLRPQNGAIWQHQALQNVEVVLARVVRHVDAAA
mmetsp:Transcript_20889/g.62856  ORF Transcript_20889/g.62856 Transcript_20889/m.62856 type:complete len:282 (+) Transcript_20889:603-1448(+)